LSHARPESNNIIDEMTRVSREFRLFTATILRV